MLGGGGALSTEPTSQLMISVSGVRGVVGRSLTPELMVRMGQAFGTYLGPGKVVVGRDTRVSGEMVKHAVFGGLISTGCTICDVGIVATPTATLMIEELKARGGIVISASHNPVEWNALKFFRADGLYLNADEGRDLLNIYYSGDFLRQSWDGLHEGDIIPDSEVHHVEKVLSVLDVDLIRRRNFCVALDCCNGAGVGISLRILRALNCHIEPIHCTPDGLFPHTPEPNFVNLQDLCRFTKERGADVGFATDPDADRVAVVAETGEFLGEELSLVLAAECILSRDGCASGPVVTNMSTSRMVEDVARAAGREVLRTPVGEIHVAERMLETGSPVGGEGNGGVIYPRVHCGRDAVVGMGLMLELMARTGKTIGELAAARPRYYMIKEKTACPSARAREIIRRLRREVSADRVETEDGIRLAWKDRWIHLRASNTEPVLRLIAETPSAEETRHLVDEYTERLGKQAAETRRP